VFPLILNQWQLRRIDRIDSSSDLSQIGQEGHRLVLTG
jgi:hypothetical protein